MEFKSLRGSSWVNPPDFCRSNHRNRFIAGHSIVIFGFRLIIQEKKGMKIKSQRGGSWDILPRGCRSAFRINFDPRDFRNDVIGFRLIIQEKHET